jgi:sRNA-binding protein
MSRSLTLEKYKEALNLWDKFIIKYPKCFFPAGKEKPLKIGIFHDLVAKANELTPAPSKNIIRIFIQIYVSTVFYRAAFIQPNSIRVDLEGNEIEPISAKERLKAKTQTRTLHWALEEGFEVKITQEKAKRKELMKIKNDPMVAQEPIITEKPATQKIKANPPTISSVQVSSTNKKPVVVVIKKKRNIKPPENH